MKAIILEKAGGIKNLILKEVEKPVAKENEVLIEVKAISINPVDFKVRKSEGAINGVMGGNTPIILGWDIAGLVAAVGTGVSQFKIGDRVFGMVNFPGIGSGYAEFVAAYENHLAKIPENISYNEAAATTLAALTALQVLQSRVKKGNRVLIRAGSGGVGHFAIQMAKKLGAYVITTSSAKNRDFVMSLGADAPIDYRVQPFEKVATEIDFVLDGMGGDILTNSVKVVNEGGTIISIPTPQFPEEAMILAKERKVNISNLMVQSSGKDMKTLREQLEKGAIKPFISATFPFEKIGEAHLQLESGRTVGKVVVVL